jgi:hypothetical protein
MRSPCVLKVGRALSRSRRASRSPQSPSAATGPMARPLTASTRGVRSRSSCEKLPSVAGAVEGRLRPHGLALPVRLDCARGPARLVRSCTAARSRCRRGGSRTPPGPMAPERADLERADAPLAERLTRIGDRMQPDLALVDQVPELPVLDAQAATCLFDRNENHSHLILTQNADDVCNCTRAAFTGGATVVADLAARPAQCAGGLRPRASGQKGRL